MHVLGYINTDYCNIATVELEKKNQMLKWELHSNSSFKKAALSSAGSLSYCYHSVTLQNQTHDF